jgi:hypothetical protein
MKLFKIGTEKKIENEMKYNIHLESIQSYLIYYTYMGTQNSSKLI